MAKNVVCSHCSSLIYGDLKSCPNCGAPIETSSPIEANEPKPDPIVQPKSTYEIPQATLDSVQSMSYKFFGVFRKSKKFLFIAIAIIATSLICFCGVSIALISSLQNR